VWPAHGPTCPRADTPCAESADADHAWVRVTVVRNGTSDEEAARWRGDDAVARRLRAAGVAATGSASLAGASGDAPASDGLSRLDEVDAPPPLGCTPTRNSRFVRAWTHLHRAWASCRVRRGPTPTTITVEEPGGRTARLPGVRVPASRASVRGLLVGDPCFSNGGAIPCAFGTPDELDVRGLLTGVLDAGGFDFWTVLGDNFYDATGAHAREFFGGLSLAAKRTLFSTVLGNHDVWVLGHPALAQPGVDPLGWGFAQYFGGAEEVRAAEREGDTPPPAAFFFHHVVGRAGFIGFSSAHVLGEQDWAKACAYFDRGGAGENATRVFLMAHWALCNDGCVRGMDAGEAYRGLLSNRRACAESVARRLVHVSGHVHVNGRVGESGMVVGAAGMSGGPGDRVGFVVVEVEEDALRVTYFAARESGDAQRLVECVRREGEPRWVARCGGRRWW